jgi:hypothetical protein
MLVPELPLLLKSEDLAAIFQPLPVEISGKDAETSEDLHAAFTRLFRCEAAKARRNVVFVWTVRTPYQHHTGHKKFSQIVYIEKTKATIWLRWKAAYIKKITTDYERRPLNHVGMTLREYADADRNFTFYGRMAAEHGPLQIWWAPARELNEVAGSSLLDSFMWEQMLLARYRQEHGCRPLKNRTGGAKQHRHAISQILNKSEVP